MSEDVPSGWAASQVKTILAEAKQRYGPAWALMSEDQRENYINSRLLFLIIGQTQDKYAPARAIARGVFAALAKVTRSTP